MLATLQDLFYVVTLMVYTNPCVGERCGSPEAVA